MYKVSPFGYFSRVHKVSQGPWFKEPIVEDDGLEYFYVYKSGSETVRLLSNNVPIEDRERLDRVYRGYNRATTLGSVASLWLGLETVLRVPYFKKMATGWRVLSMVGLWWGYK
jgi:hypothetical protein